MKILFIGIGKMGLPMALHLATKGHTVKVIDQDLDRIKIGIKNLWISNHGGRMFFKNLSGAITSP